MLFHNRLWVSLRFWEYINQEYHAQDNRWQTNIDLQEINYITWTPPKVYVFWCKILHTFLNQSMTVQVWHNHTKVKAAPSNIFKLPWLLQFVVDFYKELFFFETWYVYTYKIKKNWHVYRSNSHVSFDSKVRLWVCVILVVEEYLYATSTSLRSFTLTTHASCCGSYSLFRGLSSRYVLIHDCHTSRA